MLESTYKKLLWLQAAIEEIEREIGHLPTEEELADNLNLTVGEFHLWARGQVAPHLSDSELGLAVGDSQDTPFQPGASRVPEAPPRPYSVESCDPRLADCVREHAQRLPSLHQKVLILYFFENLRLPEIAQACNEPELVIARVCAECLPTIQAAMQECAAPAR